MHIMFIIMYFYQDVIGSRDFFFVPAFLLSVLKLLFLLSLSVSLIILFHSCCSHAQVFWKTLVHEFPISYSHTEWYLHLSRGEIVLALAEASPIKIYSYYTYFILYNASCFFSIKVALIAFSSDCNITIVPCIYQNLI